MDPIVDQIGHLTAADLGNLLYEGRAMPDRPPLTDDLLEQAQYAFARWVQLASVTTTFPDWHTAWAAYRAAGKPHWPLPPASIVDRWICQGGWRAWVKGERGQVFIDLIRLESYDWIMSLRRSFRGGTDSDLLMSKRLTGTLESVQQQAEEAAATHLGYYRWQDMDLNRPYHPFAERRRTL